MDLYKFFEKDDELTSKWIQEDEKTDFLSTNVISLNLLFSGRIDGGIPLGKVSMIASPSMLGKSLVALSLVKNAQKKGMKVVFIDSEKSFNFSLVKGMGIKTDKENLIVVRENGIERIKSLVTKLQENLTLEQAKNTLIILDSLGVLVTSKSIKDALINNDVADMTVSKKKNELMNLFLFTDFTVFVVNHTYQNIGGYGDLLSVSGGGKAIYNCQSIVMGTSVSKDKDKNKDITGSIVTCRTFKSRYAKRYSQLQFRIKNSGGLDIFYGILDDAIEGNFVKKSKPGKYIRSHIDNDVEISEKDLYCSSFWFSIFKDTEFKQYLENKYSINNEKFDIVDEEQNLDDLMNI